MNFVKKVFYDGFPQRKCNLLEALRSRFPIPVSHSADSPTPLSAGSSTFIRVNIHVFRVEFTRK